MAIYYDVGGNVATAIFSYLFVNFHYTFFRRIGAKNAERRMAMSYSWGSDTGGSSDLKSSLGYDYASARAEYSHSASRRSTSPSHLRRHESDSYGYGGAKVYGSLGSTPAPIGKDTDTKSTHPIVIAMDVTGSMGMWPGMLLERFALLGTEVGRYAPNYEICLTAFGDAYCDSAALQVPKFASGPELEEICAKLYPEGNGGDTSEDPSLVAYYFLNHCKINEAVKPILLLITDAPCHTHLDASVIKKWTGDKVDQNHDSIDLLKKLSEKFSVYVILRNNSSAEWWSGVYNPEQIKALYEPRDIIEMIIGIVASEVGEIKDFEMRSSKRHEDKPDRVERVMKSLRSEDDDADSDSEEAGKSTTSSSKSGMKSKKLI